MSKKSRTAYSLLELSIVIVIISILISGAMTVSVGNINIAKTKVTKDRMQVLYKALGKYVAATGRLPCPADITMLKSNDAYGTSVGTAGACTGTGSYQSTSDTNLVYGMVPAVTLGLSKDMAEDGFEDKIAYVVNKNYTVSANTAAYPDFSQVNFSTYTTTGATAAIVVQERGVSTFSSGAFILISYGPNKKGAFGINSTTRNARAATTETEERSNDIDDSNNFDATFAASSNSSDAFDDIITIYNTPRQFIQAFDLYRLVPCNNSGDETNYPNSPTNSKNAWFGQVVYGNNCSGTDNDKTYMKKCGHIGTWVIQSSCSLLPSS